MSVGSGRTGSSAVPMGYRDRLGQHPKPGDAVFMQSVSCWTVDSVAQQGPPSFQFQQGLRVLADC